MFLHIGSCLLENWESRIEDFYKLKIVVSKFLVSTPTSVIKTLLNKTYKGQAGEEG